MSREKMLEIQDLDMLVDWSRKLVYCAFGAKEDQQDIEVAMMEAESLEEDKESTEELNQVLPLNESIALIKSYLVKKKRKSNQEIVFFISDDDYHVFLEDLNRRLVSNLIGSLVNKGVLDSAFDDERNDFIFWVKGK